MAATPEPSAPPAPTGGKGGAGTYRSLYRRYRPQRFDEVKGQAHVTVALRNAVRDGRLTHAYLFSGPRGTGKTSTARILAKALNCVAPADGEPCGACASCEAIAAGASFDVHELDAASTNGVEAMRDLVARAALATPGRWKVYIVDEVHMLSTAASNALLKTLEEPPDHVVFVLATTDPQKVLATIRSRTQHYEFHLIADDVLAPLLAEVAATADLGLPEGALAAALHQGRGSARDALSALDQMAAGGVVVEDEGALAPLVAGLAERDVAAVLSALDAVIRAGRDPQQLAVDLVGRLRRAFFLLVAPALRPPGELPVDAEESAVAGVLGTARIVRAMEVLGTAAVAMREAPDPRITLEVALVRLAHPEADDSPAALLERLERLERRLAAAPGAPPGAASPPVPPSTAAPAGAPPTPPPPSPPGPPSPAPSPGDEHRPPGARPALGAYRAAGPRPPVGEAPEAPGAPPEAPRAPAGRPGGEPPEPPAAPPGEGAGPAAAGGPSAGAAAPSREELVTAWGDHVLVGLRPKVRAIFQAGRFVAGGAGGARFALPNEAHLLHAEPLRSEVAAALGRHFGGEVLLHLEVEPGPGPLATKGGGTSGGAGPAGPARRAGPARAAGPVEASDVAGPAEDPGAGRALEEHDEHLPDEHREGPAGPPDGISWAEDRLRRAFPGAEEV